MLEMGSAGGLIILQKRRIKDTSCNYSLFGKYSVFISVRCTSVRNGWIREFKQRRQGKALGVVTVK